MIGPLPLAVTLSVVVAPALINFGAGCVTIPGGSQTVTVARLLATLNVPLHVLVTRTQYDRLAVSAGVVYVLPVPTKMLVSSYH